MRIEAYLRIAGDRAIIAAIQKEIAGLKTSAFPLKSDVKTPTDNSWILQTERMQLDELETDTSLGKLLTQYRPFFPAIKKYKSAQIVIVLQVVTLYGANDRPMGFHLSSNTITLLAELGCELDNDAVPDVEL